MTQLAFTGHVPATGGLRFQQFETQGRRFAASKAKSWNAEARTFEAVLASETPCKTYRWTADWDLIEVEEVLPMRALKDLKAIRGKSLLNSHMSWDVENIVGVIEDAWIEGTNLVIRARLSDRDSVRGIAQDVASGVINSLSVGFEILKDGRAVERAGKLPLIEVASWSVREGSLVADPADKTAKIRSAAPQLLSPSNGSSTMDIETFKTQFAARHAARAAADANAIIEDVVALLTAAPAAPAPSSDPTPAAGGRSAEDLSAIATLRTAVAARSAALVPSFDALEKTGATIPELRSVLTASLVTTANVTTAQTTPQGARSVKDIRFSDTSAGKIAAGQ